MLRPIRGLRGVQRLVPAVRYSTNIQAGASEFKELRERGLLQHTIRTSTEGDATSVLAAMDDFWDTYYRGQQTEEWKLRGAAIDNVVKAKSPSSFLELGAYCGYSAVRIGRLLPPGAKLVSVEIDPLYAAIATKVVEHAGLSGSVKIEIGTLAEKIESIQSKHALGPLDGVLMDHGPSEYVGDLKLLETKGLLKEDTAVLCDWTLYEGSGEDPQAPAKHDEFVAYMEKSGRAAMSRQSLRNKEVFSVNMWSGFPI